MAPSPLARLLIACQRASFDAMASCSRLGSALMRNVMNTLIGTPWAGVTETVSVRTGTGIGSAAPRAAEASMILSSRALALALPCPPPLASGRPVGHGTCALDRARTDGRLRPGPDRRRDLVQQPRPHCRCRAQRVRRRRDRPRARGGVGCRPPRPWRADVRL